MKLLVACEESGRVRDAFAALGHDAWSCDVLPSATPGKHIQGNVLQHIHDGYGWDMLIGFPPCTYLCFAGIRWNVGNEKRQAKSEQALMFFCALLDSPAIARAVCENPVGIITRRVRKWDQMIHPWQFGHGEEKKTCLWLRNTPPLTPTKIVEGREQRAFRMWPGPNRARDRARTYPGIAKAMAEQWGNL